MLHYDVRRLHDHHSGLRRRRHDRQAFSADLEVRQSDIRAVHHDDAKGRVGNHAVGDSDAVGAVDPDADAALTSCAGQRKAVEVDCDIVGCDGDRGAIVAGRAQVALEDIGSGRVNNAREGNALAVVSGR